MLVCWTKTQETVSCRLRSVLAVAFLLQFAGWREESCRLPACHALLLWRQKLPWDL